MISGCHCCDFFRDIGDEGLEMNYGCEFGMMNELYRRKQLGNVNPYRQEKP